MRTKAKVIALSEKGAVVETERTSACEGCHKNEDGKGCSVCSLMGGDRKFSALAENTVGARVGDTVIIETETQRVLWYAVLVFLMPLIAAGLAFTVAYLCRMQVPMQALLSIVAFVACFIGLFVYSKTLQKKRFDVRITEIVQTIDFEKTETRS